MRKEFRAFLTLSAVVLAAAIPALAADNTTVVRVTVPFAFTAGDKSLPAGEYFVSENSAHVLTIGGKGGSTMLLSRPGDESMAKVHALSFHHTDKGIALSSVSLSSSPSEALSIVSQ